MRQFNINSSNLNNYFFTFNSYDRAQYKNDWKSYEHMHAFSEIFVVIDGKGVFHTNSKDYPIQKGMLILVNPMTVHTEISSQEEPLEYAVFSVNDLLFSDKKGDSQKQIFIYDFSQEYDTVIDLIKTIETEETQKRPFWENAIITKFNELLLLVLRKTKLYSIPFDSSEKPNTMGQVNLFLRSRFQEDITLDMLADIFFLNKYYLSHAYKKAYNIPIMKHLSIIRCNEAKTLLEATNLPISEIALSVGFNSISHFSETYKSTIKESPAKTRKNFYEKRKDV